MPVKEDNVRGTMICEVTDTDEGRAALELSARLSARLGSRLVLVHVAEGITSLGNGSDEESVTMKASREGGGRLLGRLAAEYGVAETAERRSAVGDAAALIGQIAAEEAADVIVVGARPRGWFRRGIECRLADELESETPVPVLIAPLRSRLPKAVAMNGARR
jgi:nucleotide-binding universal stress UspA family protein